MKYGLVEDGDIFKKGDEMFLDSSHEWVPIPEEWHGMKIIRDETTTFGRFKMLVRRLIRSDLNLGETI